LQQTAYIRSDGMLNVIYGLKIFSVHVVIVVNINGV